MGQLQKYSTSGRIEIGLHYSTYKKFKIADNTETKWANKYGGIQVFITVV